MIRTGVALWTAFNVAWAALLLSPSVASATWDGAKCLQYQLYGKFEFVASNGTSVFNFTSLADSRNVEGTVETVPKNRLDPVWHGRVFGKLEGDKLQLNVYWDAGTTSVFVSTIGPAGRIEGYSYLRTTRAPGRSGIPLKPQHVGEGN